MLTINTSSASYSAAMASIPSLNHLWRVDDDPSSGRRSLEGLDSRRTLDVIQDEAYRATLQKRKSDVR
jgi:hypothetical protein